MGAWLRRCVLAGLLGLLAGAPAAAQAGSISGRLTDAGTGAPLANARVEVRGPDGTVVGSAVSAEDGAYRVSALPAGSYEVVVTMLGYETGRRADVRVSAGRETVVALQVASLAYPLNPVIVTASKKAEKATDAPATVSVVTARQIEERPVVTPVDHLRETPGVNIITEGLQASNVVLRGFNNIFSGSLHMLTDYRIASVPSLRVNLIHFIPANDEDIDHIEVVLGPGSALYGPNTANGVLHIITKSPLSEQGSVVSVGGGERSVFQAEFRTAQLLSPNFGIKVSGQYLRGDDWRYTDPVEDTARQHALVSDPATRIGLRSFGVEKIAGDVRADWRTSGGVTTVFSAGWTDAARGIELTGIGAAQVRNWLNSYYQVRTSYDRFFGQVYLNASNAGDTYTLRDGNAIIDRSKLFVAQLQHGLAIGTRQSFTYGGDYIRTMPATEGTINGRNENDDNIDEVGAYLQSRTALSPKLDLVLAGRVDKHSELDHAVYSPRAGLVFKPTETQSFRFTYNRAFSTPSALNLFLDINAGPLPAPLGALGFGARAQAPGRQGFQFGSNGGFVMRSPFAPQSALPVSTGALWQIGIPVLAAQATLPPSLVALLRSLTPTSADIGISYLDLAAAIQKLEPLTSSSNFDLPGIRESATQTFEAGYKGILADRLVIDADLWHSHESNFVSPLTPQTPLLFLNGADIARYLVPQLVEKAGMSVAEATATATQIAQGLGQLPLAVITSDAVDSQRADVLVTYRNFGKVDLVGGDLGVTALLSDTWSALLTGSFISKDYFTTQGENVALNAPKWKGTASLAYRDEGAGLNGEARVRYTAGFPANSATYRATACLGGAENIATEPCVKAYTLVDLSFGYRLPGMRGASLLVNVQNLLNTGYQPFPGVPTMGRFALARIRYAF